MDFHYSNEKNVLILLSLFKSYGVKRVIASPGAINIPVVASMQQDAYFILYSCVDERSAAYMAVGLAEETGEPVVLSCTGATASRNYMPGLTEAYYRKLPVIALTSSRDICRIGQLFPQVTDRTAKPNDIVVDSVWIQTIKDSQDEWNVNLKLNRTLNALKEGPVHINITDAVNRQYNIESLPAEKKILTITVKDKFPEIIKGKIAIFVGEHKRWTEKEIEAIDSFCASHDAVVLCDHTSKYHGRYRVLYSLIGSQIVLNFDLLIHIGEVSGAYDIFGGIHVGEVWRVNRDGAYRDFFQKLSYVFKMDEFDFFSKYITNDNKDSLLKYCLDLYLNIYKSLPEFPFSNLYIGKRIGVQFPKDSVLYLGILNTLRTWNYFEITDSVMTYSNVGGFGIDGILSTVIGASYADSNKLYYAVLGDLSFFYDMNSLGNRYVGNNLRIMLINNGKGVEFRNYNHQASFMGDYADEYVAAAGHWGCQSRNLVRHYVQDLGFRYIKAESKAEFEESYKEFLSVDNINKPIVFEVFVNPEDDVEALRMLRIMKEERCIEGFQKDKPERSIKSVLKNVIGKTGVEIIKKIRN